MRTIPAALSPGDQYASEPLPFVKIAWGSGTKCYSVKDYEDDPFVYDGRIVSFGTLDSKTKVSGSSEVSSVQITLSDFDGSIKTIYDTESIQTVICEVGLAYPGGSWDTILLLTGKITAPVWTEGARLFKFTVDNYTDSEDVGYAPEEGDFTYLHPDAVGKPWPLVFGTVTRVPAVRVIKPFEGTLSITVSNTESMYIIENGRDFPQDQQLTVFIDNVKFTGSFNGDEFDPVSKNMNLGSATFNAHQGGGNNLAWSDDRLDGQYIKCSVGGTVYINKCTSQEGDACIFEAEFPSTVGASATVIERSYLIRDSWLVGSEVWLVSPVVYQDAVKWLIKQGARVLSDPAGFDLYICNLVASTAIEEVIGIKDGNFNYLPKNYYTIIPDTTALTGQAATGLEIVDRLTQREEGWGDEVFVSLRSTLPVGSAFPYSNTSDIIKYILETYTNVTADTTTFADVKAEVSGFPANFAYSQRTDALALCESICFQARLGLRIVNQVAYLVYLSKLPTSTLLINDDNIDQDSLVLGVTDADSLATKLRADWQRDYSESEHQELFYENNVDTFGLIEQSYDFFIYNIAALVKCSLDFWGFRYSNTWKTLSLTTYFENIALECFDTPMIDTLSFGEESISGVTLGVKNDCVNPEIEINMLLDVHEGTVTTDNEFWLHGVDSPDLSTLRARLNKHREYDEEIEDDEDEEKDGDGSFRNDIRVPDEILWLVFFCFPNYAVDRVNFNYCIELHNKPNPGNLDLPVKQTIDVRLDLQTHDVHKQPTLRKFNHQYIQLVDGKFCGSTNVQRGTLPTDYWMRLIARAITFKKGMPVNGIQKRIDVLDKKIRMEQSPHIRILNKLDIPADLLDLITIVTPTNVVRGVTFNVEVTTKSNVHMWITIVENTDKDDTLTDDNNVPRDHQRFPNNGKLTIPMRIQGGEGTDTAKIKMKFDTKACEGDEQWIEGISDEINITGDTPYPDKKYLWKTLTKATGIMTSSTSPKIATSTSLTGQWDLNTVYAETNEKIIDCNTSDQAIIVKKGFPGMYEVRVTCWTRIQLNSNGTFVGKTEIKVAGVAVNIVWLDHVTEQSHSGNPHQELQCTTSRVIFIDSSEGDKALTAFYTATVPTSSGTVTLNLISFGVTLVELITKPKPDTTP